jgi:hypothetical protein
VRDGCVGACHATMVLTDPPLHVSALHIASVMPQVDRKIASNLGDPPAVNAAAQQQSHSLSRRPRAPSGASGGGSGTGTGTGAAASAAAPQHRPASVTLPRGFALGGDEPDPAAAPPAPSVLPVVQQPSLESIPMPPPPALPAKPPTAPTAAASALNHFFSASKAARSGADGLHGAHAPAAADRRAGGIGSSPLVSRRRVHHAGASAGSEAVDVTQSSSGHINFAAVIADSAARRNSQHVHAPLPDYEAQGGASLLTPETARSVHIMLALRRPTSPFLRPKGLRPKYLDRAAGIAAARVAAAAAVASGGSPSSFHVAAPNYHAPVGGSRSPGHAGDSEDRGGSSSVGGGPLRVSSTATEAEAGLLEDARGEAGLSPDARGQQQHPAFQPQQSISEALGLSGVALKGDATPSAADDEAPANAARSPPPPQQRRPTSIRTPGALLPLNSLGAVMEVLGSAEEGQGEAPDATPARRKALAATGGADGGITATDESERAGALLLQPLTIGGRGAHRSGDGGMLGASGGVHHMSVGRLSSDGASLVGGDDHDPSQARVTVQAQPPPQAASGARPVSAAVASAHAAAAHAAEVAASVTAKVGLAPSPRPPQRPVAAAGGGGGITAIETSPRPQLDAAALISPASGAIGGRFGSDSAATQGGGPSTRRIQPPLSFRRTKEAAHQAFLATRNWKAGRAGDSGRAAASEDDAGAAAASAAPVLLTDATIARLSGAVRGAATSLSPGDHGSVIAERPHPRDDDRSIGTAHSDRDSPVASPQSSSKSNRRVRLQISPEASPRKAAAAAAAAAAADEAVGGDTARSGSSSPGGARRRRRSNRRTPQSPTFIGGGASPRRQPYLTQERGHMAGYATLHLSAGLGKDAPPAPPGGGGAAASSGQTGDGPVSTHFGHPRPPSSKVSPRVNTCL